MHIGISRVPPNITGELTMAMTCLVVSHYTPGGGHKRLKPTLRVGWPEVDCLLNQPRVPRLV
jgi:hypothetical protein